MALFLKSIRLKKRFFFVIEFGVNIFLEIAITSAI